MARPTVKELTFDGIAGESSYWIVSCGKGFVKEFNGVLQGGSPFPRFRAYFYAWTHSC